MQDRISHGAKQDVMALTCVACITAGRARALYRAGLRTLEAVAAAPLSALQDALSALSTKTGAAAQRAERRMAARVSSEARAAVAERACRLHEEADDAAAAAEGRPPTPLALALEPPLQLQPPQAQQAQQPQPGDAAAAASSPLTAPLGKRGTGCAPPPEAALRALQPAVDAAAAAAGAAAAAAACEASAATPAAVGGAAFSLFASSQQHAQRQHAAAAASAAAAAAVTSAPFPLSSAVAAAAAAQPAAPPPLPAFECASRAPPLPPRAAPSEEEVAAATAAHAAWRGACHVRDANAAGWEALRRRWEGAGEYSFAVAWERAPYGHAAGPGPRLRGVALAFSSPAAGSVAAAQPCGLSSSVFYVPFAKTPAGEARRAAAAALLARHGPLRATVDAKEAVQALACRAPRAALPAACLAALGDGTQDVRLMAWLLSPGEPALFQGGPGVGGGFARFSAGNGAAAASSAAAAAAAAARPEALLAAIGLPHAAAVAAATWSAGPIAPSSASLPSSSSGAYPQPGALHASLRAAACAPSHGAAASLACRSAAVARAAAGALRPRLESHGLNRPLMRLEMPLVPVIAAMELAGVAFAPDVMRQQVRAAEARLAELERRARALAGDANLQLSSHRDVAHALFGVMGFVPPGDARLHNAPGRGGRGGGRGGRGGRLRAPKPGAAPPQSVSVGEKALLELARSDGRARPVVAAVLEHRQLARAVALCDGLVASLPKGATGAAHRLHGYVYQTNTETGRLAMDAPCLHTVPHAVPFALAKPTASSSAAAASAAAAAPNPQPHARLAPRAAFAPPSGRLLLVADFRQFELRIIAEASQEGVLAAAFAGADDPFASLAARWLKKPRGSVTPAEREFAKSLAYGLLYGKGVAAIAADLGIPISEAGDLVDAFRSSIPTATAWLSDVVAAARAAQPVPHVRTLAGRLRLLPALAAAGRDSSARAAAERKAVNTVCQGSAADVLKTALVSIQRRLAAVSASPPAQPGRPRPPPPAVLVLSVHDDVVLEVAGAHVLAQVAGLVRAAMVHAGAAAGLAAPLAVRLRAGPSWDELADITE